MKIRNKRKLAAVVAFAVFLVWVLWANTALEVNEYVIRSDRIPGSFSGFRIVQISDLHNARFGENNSRLLGLIADARPDIIVITGDLVDSSHTDIGIALDFSAAAAGIAPVYYVTGNHEAQIAELTELKTGLRNAGVTILENERIALERDGACITLMGIDDPTLRSGTAHTLRGLMEGSAGYTILLSHRPELIADYAACGVDLVFSGHAHGGQFRIPFVGGLVAPHQGLFPAYDAGLYTMATTNMIVSRGIGNSICPLRFNNRPEIIVAELAAR